MTVLVLEGDARVVLAGLESESVQCVVTSPPYWGLRDYGTAKWVGGDVTCEHRPRGDSLANRPKGSLGGGTASVDAGTVQRDCHCGATRIDSQFGLERTPDEYVARMVEVFREVRRVLRGDGTLWLNLGDSYTGSGKGGNPDDGKQATNRGSQTIGTLYGKTGETAREAAVTNVSRRLCAEQGIAPKNLVGIPWRVAFALQNDGWYLRSEIIWHKPNPMPESVTDRPTKSHEQIFLLTKSPTYYYDAAAIAEEAVYTERGGTDNGVYSLGTGTRQDHGRHKSGGFPVSSPTRNRRSVWTVPTSPYSGAHFATFPPALIEPCILAGSSNKACEHCGAAWVRVVEREQAPEYSGGKAALLRATGAANHRSANGPPGNGLGVQPSRTTGFAPSCSCPNNSGTARSVVLDPFGGAGTTGLVADRLGRNAVLIELNPEYAAMARRRIHSDCPLFTDVA